MINQNKILRNIRKYLENRGRDEFAENLSPGYCVGFALLFRYLAAKNQIEQFYKLLNAVAERDSSREQLKILFDSKKDSAEWKSANKKLQEMIAADPKLQNKNFTDLVNDARADNKLSQKEMNLLLSEIVPDDPSVEKLLNLIEWLQRSSKYTTVASDKNSKFEFISDNMDSLTNVAALFNEKAEFETAMNLPKEKLDEILDKIPPGRFVDLTTGIHAMNLYRDDNGAYYYYDSNVDEIPPTFTNAKELSRFILEQTYESYIGTHIPIGLSIISQPQQPDHNYNELATLCNQYIGDENASKIIKDGNNHDYPGTGLSPLHLGMRYNLTVVKPIIERTKNISATNGIGMAAIHLAAFYGKQDHFNALIESGALIDQPVQLIKSQLSESSQSLFNSIDGVTPLYFAISNNNLEMANFLVANTADTNASSIEGMNSLIIAALNGHRDMVKLLLDNGAKENTIIHTNEVKPKKQSEKKLPLESLCFGAIHAYDYNGYNAAMCAAKHKFNDIVADLLDSKTDINYANNDGLTLIHMASMDNNVDLAKILIDKKADVNALYSYANINSFYAAERTTKTLKSPLWIVCENGNVALAKLLIENGANVNHTSLTQTPLDIACKQSPPNYQLINLLLEHNAAPAVRGLRISTLDSAASKLTIPTISKILSLHIKHNLPIECYESNPTTDLLLNTYYQMKTKQNLGSVSSAANPPKPREEF